MKNRNSYYRYLIAMVTIMMLIGFSNPVWASTPEIYSITPDTGSNKTSTYVTINGANFLPTPTVALYGGGPYITGSCDTPGSALNVYISGSYAYVADRYSGLQVIDISDPANPVIVAFCDTPGGVANDVHIAGNYVYVADWYSGLHVIEKFSPLTDIQYIDSGTFTVTIPAGYRPGTYNLHVINPDGGYALLHNAFTIIDNQPPVASAGPDQTVAVDSDCMAYITLDGSASSDPDSDPLTYNWTWDGGSANGANPRIQLPLGTTTITLIVDDGALDSDPDTVDINVIDETPPEISLTVNPDTLWPPNHKMVLITPAITVTDNCDSDPIVELASITMNEGDETNAYHPDYDTTIGDGNTINDIQVDENGDIYLRAERSGSGNGRIYTITFTSSDASGNSATASVTVTVPHDQQ